ncbi:rab3 GTPase-activating protein catalytic subunit-like isoform X1 [Salvia splendens]|uniref:rab3 GTPase-activating protein catalytic subunit-like isoform X1 n=1 Tax=Salvia splendens TaxID=180675 RepID=UPI001C263AB1|nr:rab3 GTPase-activating protein catalytic subunit-like isoform X1 [Salvia splendens]
MEASFVSRARSAINSAAAKAEKAFTDIKKSDSNAHRDLDKQSPIASTADADADEPKVQDFEGANNKRVRPQPIKAKQDWHERLRNLRLGKKGADSGKPDNSAMAYAIFDDNLYLMHERGYSQPNDLEEELESSKAAKADIIPSSAILKQLAVAVEAGSGYSTMKDLLASSKSTSPIREKASMSISVMKSLVLREKDDKMIQEFGSDDKVLGLMNALLNAEAEFTGRTVPGMETQLNSTSLVKDIHGAPLESFVVKLSEAISCLKTLRKMASYWSRVVSEIRRLWYEGKYIPGIPPGDLPDLNSCLLYQQLQVINCCISRKQRHTAALESLESITAQADVTGSSDSESRCVLDSSFYAKTKSGELVLRLGADKRFENLTMLETGEPIYSPVVQELPLLTEDLIKETEEFVLRTGSVGAGCSQLLSDMQAFKAANPGCTLEDFVRWHSPPDWMEDGTNSDLDDTSEGGDCIKGQLSRRMQKEGNLWREFWETSKPLPAVRQAPLYDEDLAVEGILDFLEVIPPTELFMQLFLAVLGAGLIIGEATLSTNPNLSHIFNNCKNYIVVTCHSSTWVEKLDDICQVYETVETMVHNPDETMNIAPQHEEPATTGEVKSRFKKLSLIFGVKSKGGPKDSPKTTEESPDRQQFSIFSKKPPKPILSPSEKPPSGSAESEWTLV